MSTMSEHRRRRMGLPPDPEAKPEQPAVNRYLRSEPENKDTNQQKKAFRLPYWMDRKAIAWMVVTAAALIALCFLK